MTITPDAVVYLRWGPLALNATLVFTWAVMAGLAIVAHLATRSLSDGPRLSRWQNLLEAVVGGIRSQIAEISREPGDRYVPFVGTLFLFILTGNLLAVVPGFRAPTASLSTTAALAVCVFLAVPVFGIAAEGVPGYLRHYVQPTVLLLPINVVGDLSRTLALAVRLFGNIMSGTLISAILLSVVPLLFPVFTDVLGLLTGTIQAYIFAVLAMVYISSASRVHAAHAHPHER
jgi:F-type H+-transporting ATPase subunit a